MILPRLGLALSGWVAVAVAVLSSAVFPRVPVIAIFLFVCPGLAALRWVRPPGARRAPDRVAALESCVLSMALSLALCTVVAEALFLGHAFSVRRALLILAGLTSVLALVPRTGRTRLAVRRSAKSRSTAAGPPQ